MTIEITIGDHRELPVTLKKDGATFTIDPGATVKGALRNSAGLITSEVAILEAETGADWANSLVVVVFDTTETAKLTAGDTVVLEIQVTESAEPLTWHIHGIKVRQGFIT